MKKLIFLLVFCALALSSVWAQKTFSGTVLGPDGLGLPGVSVVEKGNAINGVSTDIDGKWTLTVPSEESILEFTSIGMKTVEMAAKNAAKITMKSDAKMLKGVEIVSTGYGAANKTGYTGSAAVIKNDELLKTSGGVAKALQGKVAGLQVVGSQVRVRGYGSISASSAPLYVVDGIIDAPKPNDEDIENITVLKDAAATALYGSRGANGVIVITMKKGKKGKTKFNIKYQHTVQEILSPKWGRMNAAQYYKHQFLGHLNKYPSATDKDFKILYEKFNQAMKGNNPYNIEQPFLKSGELKPNAKLLYDSNWVDEILKKAQSDNIYFSVDGGTEKNNYHISNNIYNLKGFTTGIESKGFNSDIKFSTKLNKHISFEVRSRLNYFEGENMYLDKANENNLLYVGYSLSPAASIYAYTKKDKPDGSYKYIFNRKKYNWVNPNNNDYNPLGLLKLDKRGFSGLSAFIAPKVTIEFIKDLKLSTLISGKYYTSNSYVFQNPYHGSGNTENGYSSKVNKNSKEYLLQNLLTYNFNYEDNHHFKFILGNEVFDYTYKDLEGVKVGYPLGGDISTELSSGEKPRYAESSTVEEARLSYFSNLSYDFNDKYFFSTSYRRDGSSKFGPDKRWGNFWSVGASWRISQEDFFDIEWINNLKLRTSYGVTGNNSIGNYKYGNYYSTGANYAGSTGLVHTNLPNNKLSWEESTSLSIGLDYSLFDHRLSGTIEAYKRGSDGLLYKYPIPITSGFNEVLMNIGEMDNTGLELEIKGIIIDSNDIKWTSFLTASTNKNEIKSLPTEQVLTGTKRWKVGGSLYDYYLREWAGVNPKNGDPLWYMDEKQANGKIKKVTTNDYSKATYYSQGQSTPKVFLGLSNEFTIKGFTLSVDLISGLGHKVYDGRYASAMHDGSGSAKNLSTDALDSWTPENKNAKNPRYIWNNTNKSSSASSRWLVNGDFLKVKNISLAYDLSSQLTKKIMLSSCKFFFSVDNVYSISDYRSGDPEISLSGVSNGYSFNNSRTFRFGVDIKF